MLPDQILDVVHQVMDSPWIYLVLFLLAAIDAFFPVVPSETSVITAGVFAATGPPSLPAVIAVAALGAFVGDHLSYLIGRIAGDRLLQRMRAGTRRRAALDWTERALTERGGLVLVVARYIPGGRTAVTLTMGTVGYPLRLFSSFDGIAAASWAAYSGLIGYLGGAAFEHDPIKGVLFGIGLALTVTATVELARYLRNRSAEEKNQEQLTP